MKHALPSCRARFQSADWRFVESILSPGKPQNFLQQFADDITSIDTILDEQAIFQALIEQPRPVRVSANFYFYILVRQHFLQAGLDDRNLADYVAAILADRVHASPQDAYRGIPGGFIHISDYLAILDKTNNHMRYLVQVAAGNQFLVLTGIYPEFLRHRRNRTGAPDIPFYENFAITAFRNAADNTNISLNNRDRHTLGILANSFRETRKSLNTLSTKLLFLHNPQ